MEERHSKFFENWHRHRDRYFAKLGILLVLGPGVGTIAYLYILLDPSLSHLTFLLTPFYILVIVLCFGTILILTVLNFIVKNPPNGS
jgi:hypothetical protein